MKKSQLREIIWEEIFAYLMEAPYDDDEERDDKLDKEKQDIEKQKVALAQKKQDFAQKQATAKDREQDQERAEDEKEKETDGNEKGGEEEKSPEPNISFKTQGRYYEDSYPQLGNVILSDGDIMSDEERHFVALAIQAAEGRFDKGFEKFLRTGHAGNVYGKDFSDKDIEKIVNYVRKNEIVR